MTKGGLLLLTALHDLTTMAVVCDEGILLSRAGVALAFTPLMMDAARADLARFESETIRILRDSGFANERQA